MNYMHWLIRAKGWAQNPPSEGRVKLIFGVVAACLVVAGYQWAFGWPEWLVVDNMRQ